MKNLLMATAVAFTLSATLAPSASAAPSARAAVAPSTPVASVGIVEAGDAFSFKGRVPTAKGVRRTLVVNRFVDGDRVDRVKLETNKKGRYSYVQSMSGEEGSRTFKVKVLAEDSRKLPKAKRKAFRLSPIRAFVVPGGLVEPNLCGEGASAVDCAVQASISNSRALYNDYFRLVNDANLYERYSDVNRSKDPQACSEVLPDLFPESYSTFATPEDPCAFLKLPLRAFLVGLGINALTPVSTLPDTWHPYWSNELAETLSATVVVEGDFAYSDADALDKDQPFAQLVEGEWKILLS